MAVLTVAPSAPARTARSANPASTRSSKTCHRSRASARLAYRVGLAPGVQRRRFWWNSLAGPAYCLVGPSTFLTIACEIPQPDVVARDRSCECASSTHCQMGWEAAWLMYRPAKRAGQFPRRCRDCPPFICSPAARSPSHQRIVYVACSPLPYAMNRMPYMPVLL